ncbi:MAG: DUF599 domain-containing protein [Pseudomonadota bacterium]
MENGFHLLRQYFGPGDVAAVLLLTASIWGVTWLVERGGTGRRSVARLMTEHRQRWMKLMAQRDNRIVDSGLLTVLHRGAAFFASASLIGIGGIIALIGQSERLLGFASDLTPDATNEDRVIWEIKLLFILCLMALAFLKFVWAHRLLGYCAVLIGATPENKDTELHRQAAAKAAAVNVRAGSSFNRGLRLVYFSLATLAWFFGPMALAVATMMTALMLYRREFLSETHRILSE